MKSTEKKDLINEQRSKLSALMKAPSNVPIQEIRPVQPAPPVSAKPELSKHASTHNKLTQPPKEVHVNFKADEKLMERVWIYAAKARRSLKQIAAVALSEYLDRNQAT
jgi:hypothetical protein